MFPPTVRDFVPEGHLAHLVRDVVRGELDLSEVEAAYGEERGQPPYASGLMVALLLYAYSRGVYSSRAIERACEERVDFMAVTGRSKPDHDAICDFRRRHREALAWLFVQVLELCRDAGLAKLGHVALDGTELCVTASWRFSTSSRRQRHESSRPAGAAPARS
ncbi:MAG: transposase [Planctomycetaceae bacterium]